MLCVGFAFFLSAAFSFFSSKQGELSVKTLCSSLFRVRVNKRLIYCSSCGAYALLWQCKCYGCGLDSQYKEIFNIFISLFWWWGNMLRWVLQLNTQCLKKSMENLRNLIGILTLGSFCLPYYMRTIWDIMLYETHTAWS